MFKKTKFPLLTPSKNVEWASGAVFNPGAYYDGELVHLLFRAIPKGYQRIKLKNAAPGEKDTGFDESYISQIGYASSKDGINFEWREEPLIGVEHWFNKFGSEDPRISRIDGQYLITYTALQRPAFDEISGIRIGLATTTDFKSIEMKGVVSPSDLRDKDAVIFPKRINGKIAMLHRVVPNIQIIYFDSIEDMHNPPEGLWEEHLANLEEHTIMRPEFEWESLKIGAGPTPIETPEGWLFIYHGVNANHVYRMGMALLDLDDPSKVIAKSPIPLLEPELEFELFGDVENVVFPEGAVVIDDTLHVYYGAADSVIGHAQASLTEVLNWMKLNKTTTKKLSST